MEKLPPRLLQQDFKPHPRKRLAAGGLVRDVIGRPLPDLPMDEEGRYIVEAVESEQCGFPIYGSLCPICHLVLWMTFEENQDFGLIGHVCGALLRYVKKGNANKYAV